MTLAARTLAVAAALVACVGLSAPAAAPAPPPPRATAMRSLEVSVLAQMNALRRSHGLASLRLNGRLGAAAAAHSREMVGNGFFAHESSDGTPFWKRVARWYGSGGYGYWSVGENLLWASPDVGADRALKMWLASPPHRRNLLNGRWREVGLGALHVASAPGAFKGREVTVLTADFGVRR